VGLITDGRFSGGTYGMVVGHVAPEAAVGGMIARSRRRHITIDADGRLLHLHVSDAELERRRAACNHVNRVIRPVCWQNTLNWFHLVVSVR